MQEITFHSKPVRDFAFCVPYSLFASCSERTIALWQAQTGKLSGRLSGHTAPIAALATDDACAAPPCSHGNCAGNCHAVLRECATSKCQIEMVCIWTQNGVGCNAAQLVELGAQGPPLPMPLSLSLSLSLLLYLSVSPVHL